MSISGVSCLQWSFGVARCSRSTSRDGSPSLRAGATCWWRPCKASRGGQEPRSACLSLYSAAGLEQFETSLLSLTTEDEAWRRFFVGSATEVEIDGASRVLIPPELRSWAGLEREVEFMGVGPNFELWDMARYEAREAEVIARGRPEALRTLVIR